MKYIVALTGGIGSGKSTVAKYFEAQNITVVDADVIAREVVKIGSNGLEALIAEFGLSIILSDGTLNRPYLRALMFGDEPHHLLAKERVNGILHPLIAEETRIQIETAQSNYVLWVVPLLFENHLHTKAHRILVVDVPESIQIQRTVQRDGVSTAQVEQIIKSQVNRQLRLSLADDVILGSQTLEKIEHEVIMLHEKYCMYARAVSQQNSGMKLT